ncbi:hypothetical protein [Streptomyces albidocamelliae]|uniref:Uncharacterized protein n=1 Tax=Streptomyces albidocamelliae TaxID=2981135 RepID=A0ABY6ENZ3_9ACTN|nr:hypothetical protein [Streptomyces sp. HUAS 14-6]UXY36122.1 hypothetical protein N8I86_16065 [Streptomyces sp. HUAS 14-6]
MNSTNAAHCEITHHWFGWVTVPGHGPAWASGQVSVPLCAPREQVYRLIAAWLRERGCTVPADLSQVITLLPGQLTPTPPADTATPRSI